MVAAVYSRFTDYGSAEPIRVLHGAGRARIVLTGELDEASCPELTTAIATIPLDSPVEVDTRGVTFMDSSVVAALARLATESAGPLLFLQPPALVRFLLDVTRVADFVTILDEDPGFPAPEAG